MSRDGHLPPGVDYADIPGFDDPDDQPCGECEHLRSEHTGIANSCLAGDDPDRICTCQGFTPAGAY